MWEHDLKMLQRHVKLDLEVDQLEMERDTLKYEVQGLRLQKTRLEHPKVVQKPSSLLNSSWTCGARSHVNTIEFICHLRSGHDGPHVGHSRTDWDISRVWANRKGNQMARYRKKPVVVGATQWFKNGDHPNDGGDGTVEGKVVRYFRRPDVDGSSVCKHCDHIMHRHGWIDTLEGGHIVCPGDWVITGVQGERYPCKPDIFEATYEKVDD